MQGKSVSRLAVSASLSITDCQNCFSRPSSSCSRDWVAMRSSCDPPCPAWPANVRAPEAVPRILGRQGLQAGVLRLVDAHLVDDAGLHVRQDGGIEGVDGPGLDAVAEGGVEGGEGARLAPPRGAARAPRPP